LPNSLPYAIFMMFVTLSLNLQGCSFLRPYSSKLTCNSEGYILFGLGGNFYVCNFVIKFARLKFFLFVIEFSS
jgi:hypothetical protein